MTPKFVLYASTVLSFASVMTYNISVFQKSKRRITGMIAFCNACDVLMYLITGGKSGMVNSVANLCKNAAFSKLDSRKLTILFACVRIILLAFSYEGIFTFLFIPIEVIVTVAMLKGTAQQLRYSHLLCQTVWVFYDYAFANIFVAYITATGCISLVSAIIKNRKVI